MDILHISMHHTYLVSLWTKQQKVKWDSSHHVDKEPAFEVVHGNLPRMWNNFVVFINVCSPKINQYIDDKHDINYQIYNS